MLKVKTMAPYFHNVLPKAENDKNFVAETQYNWDKFTKFIFLVYLTIAKTFPLNSVRIESKHTTR